MDFISYWLCFVCTKNKKKIRKKHKTYVRMRLFSRDLFNTWIIYYAHVNAWVSFSWNKYRIFLLGAVDGKFNTKNILSWVIKQHAIDFHLEAKVYFSRVNHVCKLMICLVFHSVLASSCRGFTKNCCSLKWKMIQKYVSLYHFIEINKSNF